MRSQQFRAADHHEVESCVTVADSNKTRTALIPGSGRPGSWIAVLNPGGPGNVRVELEVLMPAVTLNM